MWASPFPRSYVVMMLVGAAAAASIALFRASLYHFTSLAWVVTTSAGLAGLLTFFGLPSRWRGRLASVNGIALFGGLSFGVLILSDNGLLEREWTPPLLLFASDMVITAALILGLDVFHRQRSLRRRLRDSGALADPAVGEQLAAFFATMTLLLDDLTREKKAFKRGRRRRAGAALDTHADACDRLAAGWREIPMHPFLAELRDSQCAVVESMRDEYRRGATTARGNRARLGEGCSRLAQAAIERDRDWHYVAAILARRHKLRVPRWFVRDLCKLGCAR
jgi:hypothetical protein